MVARHWTWIFVFSVILSVGIWRGHASHNCWIGGAEFGAIRSRVGFVRIRSDSGGFQVVSSPAGYIFDAGLGRIRSRVGIGNT